MKELFNRWGVPIDTSAMTRDDMYKLLQKCGGGARVKQLCELYVDFGIAADKLRTLSESKASRIH